MVYYGVDISSIQGNVDFVWLKNNGYSFVIFRNYIGNDGRDPMCDTNLAKAKAAGLKVAIYNFVYILPTDGVHANRSPEDQATLHFNNTPKGEVVCVDLEWPAPGPDWAKYGINAAFVDDWVYRYLEKYKQLSGLTEKQIVLYTYPNFAANAKFRAEIGNYPLWYANYGSSKTMPPWTDASIVIVQDSGGNKMRLPNGCPVDTDIAPNLNLWDPPAPAVVQPVDITPLPIVPVVDPVPVQVVPTPTPAPAANESLISKIGALMSNSAFQAIAEAAFNLIKALLHIK